MSRININAMLKTKDNVHIYNGKGIKLDNKIIYNDEGIITTLFLNDDLVLERKKDYTLRLTFKQGKECIGEYIVSEGKFKVFVYTNDLIINKNSIKIKYNLKINSVNIDNFEYNLSYTIDS